jgi:hypothetical protein
MCICTFLNLFDECLCTYIYMYICIYIYKVYSARKRRIASKQVRDSPRSTLDVSPISESIGNDYDRWT